MTIPEKIIRIQKAAGLVQQAYSGGYEHPIEVRLGGAVFTPLVLSPYGGWHGGCGNDEQWTLDKQDDAYGR